jgi:hypothetical protein
VNLIFVKEEFAGAERLMVPGAAGHVLGDVGVDEPSTAGFEIDESVADVRFPFAKGFDLSAVENQARFVPLE